MAHYRTRAKTVNTVRRIRLAGLKASGCLEKDRIISQEFTIKNLDVIATCSYCEGEKYVRLQYKIETDNFETIAKDYKIKLAFVPSNLGPGRGERLYFLCPITGKRCLTLYLPETSSIFLSRQASNIPIYYPSQTWSPAWRFQDRLIALNKKIMELEDQPNRKMVYNGRPTRYALKLEALKMLFEQMKSERYEPGNIGKHILQAIHQTFPSGEIQDLLLHEY